jgi:hypothetical protein
VCRKADHPWRLSPCSAILVDMSERLNQSEMNWAENFISSVSFSDMN